MSRMTQFSHLCNMMNGGTIHRDTGHTGRGPGWFCFQRQRKKNLKFVSVGCLLERKQKRPAGSGCPELTNGVLVGDKIWGAISLQVI